MDNKAFQDILNKYYNRRPDKILEESKSASSLQEAINIAANAVDKENKKHSHQWRIPKVTLKLLEEKLYEQISKIRNAKDFDELYSIVLLCKIKGVSDLTLYDTAERIGCYLKLYPEKIYLHNGTREGAEAVFLDKIKKSLSQ